MCYYLPDYRSISFSHCCKHAMMLVNIVYNFYFVILILIFGKETITVKTDEKKKKTVKKIKMKLVG